MTKDRIEEELIKKFNWEQYYLPKRIKISFAKFIRQETLKQVQKMIANNKAQARSLRNDFKEGAIYIIENIEKDLQKLGEIK